MPADRNLFFGASTSFFIVLVSSSCGMQASASDWGYDATPPVKHTATPNGANNSDWNASEYDELKRKPAATHPVAAAAPGKAAKATTVATFSQPDVIDVDKAIRTKQAKIETVKQQLHEKNEKLADLWLELYGLVASEPLTPEQHTRFQQKLIQVVAHSPNDSFAAIYKFWPQVKQSCQSNVEQRNNYRDLLRTLLRLEVHDKQANSVEVEMLGEILGPERIAVPENPPLTEDAVEAYADMTCFIYAQTHPGKTVDALDNRTVFVATMEHRYMNDATPLEKLAMSYFALKWNKFKVLYADASESEKEKLFKRISGATPDSLRKDITNETLDAVLNNGPWVRSLTTASDVAVPKLPPKMVEERAQAKSL